jgi:hypothetical protein
MLFHNRRALCQLLIIEWFTIITDFLIAHLRWEKAHQYLNHLPFPTGPFKEIFRQSRKHRADMVGDTKCRLRNQDYNRTLPKLIAVENKSTICGCPED